MEFTCEAIWFWAFVYSEFFDYCSNIITNRSIQILCSSWFSLGRLCVSRNLSISPGLSNVLTYNYSQHSFFVCLSMMSQLHALLTANTGPEVHKYSHKYKRTPHTLFQAFLLVHRMLYSPGLIFVHTDCSELYLGFHAWVSAHLLLWLLVCFRSGPR